MGVGLAHEREASDPYALGAAGCPDADRGEYILNGPLPVAELAVQQVVPQFHRSGQELLGRDFIRGREEGGDAFRDGHGAFPPGAWYAERSLISFSGEARRYTVRNPGGEGRRCYQFCTPFAFFTIAMTSRRSIFPSGQGAPLMRG